MNPAKTYANELAQNLTKITMTDFFKEIHSRFYSDQDISFMEYFLELTEHEGEFIVHHEKLREYGIMTSTESSKVREKLNQLILLEMEDYRLADVREPVKQGGFVTKKVYHLTPEAFKKCLMRAQRRANQPVDPVIYCNYYLLLEKIHKLYMDYERLYSEKLLSMKDDNITRLENNVDELTSTVNAQSAEIKELLEQTRFIAEQNKYTHAQNNRLQMTVDEGRRDLKRSIRVIDRINIQNENTISVLDDVRDHLGLTISTIHEQQEAFTEVCREPALNPERLSEVQGMAWYVKDKNASFELILVVGQQKHVRSQSKKLTGFEILSDFVVFGSGVNYRKSIKSYLKEKMRSRISAIQKRYDEYADAISEYAKYSHDVDTSQLLLSTQTQELNAISSRIRAIKASDAHRHTEAKKLHKSYRKYMNLHNDNQRELFENKEIDRVNLVNTKDDWYTMHGFVDGVTPRKSDYVSTDELNDLSTSLSAIKKSIKSKEKKLKVLLDSPYTEEQLTHVNRARAHNEKIDADGGIPVISDIISFKAKISLGDSSESESDTSDSGAEFCTNTPDNNTRLVNGIRFYPSRLFTIDLLKKYILRFEHNSKEPKYKIDNDTVATDILDDRIGYVKEEDYDTSSEFESICDKVISEEACV